MFKIDKNIPFPGNKKSGGRAPSKYPLDDLEVGDSFHLSKTDDDLRTPKFILSGVASNARRKYRTVVMDNGKPVTETVTVVTYAKDDYKNRIKGPDGEFIVVDTKSIQKPTFIQERDFSVLEVGIDDFCGVGARLSRIK